MANKKQDKFTVYVETKEYFEAKVPADSLEQALGLVKSMTSEQLQEAKVDSMNLEIDIVGVIK